MEFGKAKQGAVCAGLGLLLAANAGIAMAGPTPLIQSGIYRLHNHPLGDVRPPLYGARFDELYNANAGAHDIFTLDFDDAQSAVYMNVNLNTGVLLISGVAYGGRDIGSAYANDIYRGLYSLSFTYNIGVEPVPGDDDIRVNAPNHANHGKLTTPLGEVDLVDERDNDFSFRFGNEDDDLGHRGVAGISGWGWMAYDRGEHINHVDATDWLFTATLIPEPATLAMVLGGLAAFAMQRRKA